MESNHLFHFIEPVWNTTNIQQTIGRFDRLISSDYATFLRIHQFSYFDHHLILSMTIDDSPLPYSNKDWIKIWKELKKITNNCKQCTHKKLKI